MDTKIISESSSSWSDLPREILWLIDQRLYLRDRVRFRFVCNNWQLPPLFDKLPWLFNRTICSLSDDPYRKLHYFTQKSKGSSHTPEGRDQFLAIASASRYGWILFHDKTTQALIKPKKLSIHNYYDKTTQAVIKPKKLSIHNYYDKTTQAVIKPKKLSIHNYSCEYYVYNPRTNAVISLPRLNLPQHHGYYFLHLATFSSDPTSPDCKFYVPTVSFMGIHFFINTYSIKDTKWETDKFRCPYPRSIVTPFMAYMDRHFYFYSGEGTLVCFDIVCKTWNMLVSKQLSLWSIEMNLEQWAYYFVAYGGHLHVVYLIEKKVIPECDIFRFDRMKRHWKRMKSLKGGAIFLGNPVLGVPSFGVSSAAIRGEETKMIANRVYYISSHTSKPCSLVYGSADHMHITL